ncbi:hypothetical protein CYMTET_10031 [Cymbomonas tetramitiformis]|uniref:Uncharacterized protein n=1 Tax=Cymbomonas tetramitiformis TaxID=36881 RepID=A0AAE0GQG1_9CHLO|nr:hypothetical protein CYMTET_10031 [Cymbomonas tetramitiformis]|eukprot:gene23343-28247_t
METDIAKACMVTSPRTPGFLEGDDSEKVRSLSYLDAQSQQFIVSHSVEPLCSSSLVGLEIFGLEDAQSEKLSMCSTSDSISKPVSTPSRTPDSSLKHSSGLFEFHAEQELSDWVASDRDSIDTFPEIEASNFVESDTECDSTGIGRRVEKDYWESCSHTTRRERERSAAVSDPGLVPLACAQDPVSESKAMTIVQRLKYLFSPGAALSVNNIKVYDEEFSKVTKYSLIVCLTMIAVFFTPDLWLKIIPDADPFPSCEDSGEKLSGIFAYVDSHTYYYDAQLQIEESREWERTVNGTILEQAHYPEWPDGCTTEEAQAAINEAKYQTCTAKKCGDYSDNSWSQTAISWVNNGKNSECYETTVSCPAATVAYQDEALLDHMNLVNQDPILSDLKTDYNADTLSDGAMDIVKAVLTQVDLASDCYILYTIVVLFVGFPIVLHKQHWQVRAMGIGGQMSQATFVVAFLLVKYTYETVMKYIINSDVLVKFWWNFYNDPCYVDPEFHGERYAYIMSACNDIWAWQSEYVSSANNAQDTYTVSSIYAVCFPEYQNQYDADTETLTTVISNYNTTDFVGECNISNLLDATNTAPATEDKTLWEFFMVSGFIAALFMKSMMANICYNFVGIIDPLALCSGKVEIVNDEDDDPEQIKTYKRSTHIVPFVVWTCITLFLIILSF